MFASAYRQHRAAMSAAAIERGLGAPDGLVITPSRHELSDRIVQRLSLVSACALHAAILIWIATGPAPDPLSGAGGEQLEAIEITIVQGAIVESRDNRIVEPDAAKGFVAPQEGDEAPIDSVQANEELKQPEEKVETTAEPVSSPLEPQRGQPQREANIDQSRGGRAASANDGARATSGPAAAGAGELRRYAAEVRAALARGKPSGRGRHGVAIVTFTISPAGTVSAAHISNSSGSVLLDQDALAAVQRASFPIPPERMTSEQLTYAIPFNFK
jgi:TonB family protein